MPKVPTPVMAGDMTPSTFYAALIDDRQMLIRRLAEKLATRIVELLSNDSPEAAEFRRVALEAPPDIGAIRMIHLFMRATVKDHLPERVEKRVDEHIHYAKFSGPLHNAQNLPKPKDTDDHA